MRKVENLDEREDYAALEEDDGTHYSLEDAKKLLGVDGLGESDPESDPSDETRCI